MAATYVPSLRGHHHVELLSFDLDDTLINTEAGAVARFVTAAETVARIRPDITQAQIDTAITIALSTHPTEGRMANFFADLGVDDQLHVAEIRDAYFGAMALQEAAPFADVLDVLAGLRAHFRLALLTNGPGPLQRAKIRRHELERYFDWIVISEEVQAEKPDRRIFDKLLDLAGTTGERAAHCGDSLATDVAGANGAGWLSIWLRSELVRSAPDRPEFSPKVTIAHVRDLLR